MRGLAGDVAVADHHHPGRDQHAVIQTRAIHRGRRPARRRRGSPRSRAPAPSRSAWRTRRGPPSGRRDARAPSRSVRSGGRARTGSCRARRRHAPAPRGRRGRAVVLEPAEREVEQRVGPPGLVVHGAPDASSARTWSAMRAPCPPPSSATPATGCACSRARSAITSAAIDCLVAASVSRRNSAMPGARSVRIAGISGMLGDQPGRADAEPGNGAIDLRLAMRWCTAPRPAGAAASSAGTLVRPCRPAVRRRSPMTGRGCRPTSACSSGWCRRRPPRPTRTEGPRP